MPSINPTLTGAGSAQINGGAALGILEVAPKVTVQGPTVRAVGLSSVQRLHQAGWVGLGYEGVGADPPLVTYGKFIEYVYEDIRLTGGLIFAVSYFWDLSPGTEIQFEIDW